MIAVLSWVFVVALLLSALLAFVALLHDDVIEPQELEEARDVTGRSKDSTNCRPFRLDQADGVIGGDR